MTDSPVLRTFLVETIASMNGPQGTMLIDFAIPIVESGVFNAEAFFEGISNILPWHLINEIKFSPERAITVPGKMEVVVDVLLQARKLWQEGAKTSDFKKLLISFAVYDRVFMIPEKDLDWTSENVGIKRAISSVLSTMKLSIEVGTSHHAGYTDKKFLSDFNTAVRSNDLSGIFDFFRTIDHGEGLYSSDIALLQYIARLSSVTNIHELVQFAERSKPLSQRIIIKAIPKDVLFSNLDALNSAGPLTNLIVLNDYFSSRNLPKNRLDDVDIEQEKSLIGLFNNIEKYSSPIGVISFICKTLNVKPNQATNSLFSMFVGQNPADLQDYIDNLDFSYDDSGDQSFNAQLVIGNEATLDELSIAITERYFLYLSRLDYHPDFFMFCSYYNFFLRAVGVKTQGRLPEYISGLEQASLDVIRSLSSWKTEDIPVFVTKWVYWIMAIKQLNLVIPDIETIPYTEHLLSNRNFMIRLSKKVGNGTSIDFGWLRTFLMKPASTNEVDIYDKDQHLRICWRNDDQG